MPGSGKAGRSRRFAFVTATVATSAAKARHKGKNENKGDAMQENDIGRRAWITLALLFAFHLINFCDKTVLGLAGVPIMNELHLTHAQFGMINASAFYLFAVSAIAVGFVVNRVSTTPVILTIVLIWSASQFAVAGPATFALLMGSRIALGAGQGPAYPVAVHALYNWFPDNKRTLPTAILSQGASFGVVVALPILNWLVFDYSWHFAFGVLGVVALVWAALWIAIGREGPIKDAAIETANGNGHRISYARLFCNRTMIATLICGFGCYWGLALLLSWFTPFLIEGLGYSQRDAGWLSTLPWAGAIVTAVTGGWISQRLLAMGVSSRLARGVFSGTTVALSGFTMLLLPFVHAPYIRLALMVIGMSFGSLIYSVGLTIASELTPTAQRGAVLAITNSTWSLAGLLAPAIMGRLIDTGATAASGYLRGFVISGGITGVAGLIGMAFMQPEFTRKRLYG